MRRRRLPLAAAASALLATGGCLTPSFVPPPFQPAPEPAPHEAAAVLFLAGDGGAEVLARAPVLHRLRQDVERWSAAAPEDSSVVVLFLGDNVYPEGVRAPGSPAFPRDSARLAAQVWTVEGPHARRRGTRGVFVPGNHDWGSRFDREGVARLRNQSELLDRFAATGAPVLMLPRPGSPGPEVLELAGLLRLVIVDTDVWLGPPDPRGFARWLNAVGAALGADSGRLTVLAAHHPIVTAGPHSGVYFTGLDPLLPLRRAGAVVQDLNAAPLRRVRRGLERTFRGAARPFIYAAGHDHSLQVLRGRGPADPAWTLVSGAVSKRSGVADAPETGLEWGASVPGYMRVVVGRDGSVVLTVVGGAEAERPCREAAPEPGCAHRAAALMRPLHQRVLRPAGG